MTEKGRTRDKGGIRAELYLETVGNLLDNNRAADHHLADSIQLWV